MYHQIWHCMCVFGFECVLECAGFLRASWQEEKEGKNKQIKGFPCSHLSRRADFAFKQVWRAGKTEVREKHMDVEGEWMKRAGKKWTWRWMSRDSWTARLCMWAPADGRKMSKNTTKDEREIFLFSSIFYVLAAHYQMCSHTALTENMTLLQSLSSPLGAQPTQSIPAPQPLLPSTCLQRPMRTKPSALSLDLQTLPNSPATVFVHPSFSIIQQ